MADPTPVEVAGGTSTAATVTVTFLPQTAGVMLVLSVAADTVRATAGSGRPESTGWTPWSDQVDNIGFYQYRKVSTGGETSVQYTLSGAASSAYTLTAVNNLDPSPLGVTGMTATDARTSQSSPRPVATVTPAAGRWCVLADVGWAGVESGAFTWSAPYTARGQHRTPGGYGQGVASATVTVDGGAPVTGSVTMPATGVRQVMSHVAALRVESATASYDGSAARAVTGVVTSAGTVGASAASTAPLSVSVSADGTVNTGGAATIPVASIIATNGTVGGSDAASVYADVGVSSTGVTGVASPAAVSSMVTVSASGKVAAAAGASLPLTATVAAAGAATMNLNGSAALPSTVSVGSDGRVSTVGGTVVPFTVGVAGDGLVIEAGGAGASRPVVVAVAATGMVGAYGPVSLPILAAVTGVGEVGRSAGSAAPAAVTVLAGGTVTAGTTSSASVATAAAVTGGGVVGAATAIGVLATVTVTASGDVIAGGEGAATIGAAVSVGTAGRVGLHTAGMSPFIVGVNGAGLVGKTSTAVPIPAVVVVAAGGKVVDPTITDPGWPYCTTLVAVTAPLTLVDATVPLTLEAECNL